LGVTVLEAIQKSTDFLSRKNIESSRLNAELLLANLLRMARMQLYLNFERKLSPLEVDQLRECITRRSRHEPLQHIIGSTSFCGYAIQVNRQVLVPRPETELLAEAGWKFLTRRPVAPAVLDFGTGSACLAIVLAAKCLAAMITAVDISEPALAVARANVAAHHLSDRIKLCLGDGYDPLPADATFDLVISNPPYIPTDEIAGLAPEVRDFDPPAALDGGPTGLGFYARLATQTPSRLRPDGRIMVELGDGQAESVRTLFIRENWIVENVLADYAGHDRVLIARRPT
jgi:release factor glutamine methyltransferase